MRNINFNIDIARTMRRFAVRIIVSGGIVIIVLNLIYIVVSWLLSKVIRIQDDILRSEIQYLLTLAVALCILFFFFVRNYRKKKRELITLSDNIQRVASGDFSSKIEYNKRDSMAKVYHDFNKMTAELSNVQFLSKEFINNYSHEFKTPIASINGFASLMLERELPREEQREYLKIIEEESDRLSRLTSSTILLTKLSSQEIIEDIEEFDLGENLRQISIQLSPQWLAKDQIFSGEFPKVMYTGNRELLQQLWLNLIGNAIKYTPRGGELSVTLAEKEDKIVVSVSDTGEGMSKETLEHLFDPYYQGKGKSGYSNQGLGLGLSIAKRIVHLCEGNIRVTSEKGLGSEFIVELPKR